MPKYWVKKLFRTWEIPRSGSKAKNGEKRRRGERERERLNDGENNGQATHGARKHAWRTQAAWAKIVFSSNSTHCLHPSNQRKQAITFFLLLKCTHIYESLII